MPEPHLPNTHSFARPEDTEFWALAVQAQGKFIHFGLGGAMIGDDVYPYALCDMTLGNPPSITRYVMAGIEGFKWVSCPDCTAIFQFLDGYTPQAGPDQ